MADLVDGLDEHINSLRRYARALVGNPDDADDLVQECLRRTLTYVREDHQIDNWRAYLFRVLHRVSVDSSMRAALDREVPIEDHLSHLSSPAPQHAVMEFLDVGRALTRLPLEQREVMLMVGLEGLSYYEVASVLDIPIGTVMSRLSRGRETLRSIMASGAPYPLLRWDDGTGDYEGQGI